MTAKHGSRPCQQIARRRRFRIAVSALALSGVIGLGAGAATSSAATTPVYFDSAFNVGAGPNPFNNLSSGQENTAVGHTMMPALTGGEQQRRGRQPRAQQRHRWLAQRRTRLGG